MLTRSGSATPSCARTSRSCERPQAPAPSRPRRWRRPPSRPSSSAWASTSRTRDRARGLTLYDLTDATPSPVFIVGAARSGTTLVRSMLGAHPELAIPPESHFLGYLGHRYGRRSWTPCDRLVGGRRRGPRRPLSQLGPRPRTAPPHGWWPPSRARWPRRWGASSRCTPIRRASACGATRPRTTCSSSTSCGTCGPICG